MTSLVENNPAWLLNYADNVHSQFGEDGVIAKILDTLPETDKWCVEFGAWDGSHLSNSRNLISTRGYSAVLIEGDRKKFEVLNKNSAAPRVILLNSFVGFEPKDNLDKLLCTTPIPHDFDFLSIDIDGNDYHVWNAVCAYRPKVVCIEFNPTIPDEVHFVQPADSTIQQGSSLAAIVELGKLKEYELVCVVTCNAVFVHRQFFDLFGISDNRPQVLRKDRSLVTYLFSGYDGSIHIDGYKELPWHGVKLLERRFQVLPRRLRTYPDGYTRAQKRQFAFLQTIWRLLGR